MATLARSPSVRPFVRRQKDGSMMRLTSGVIHGISPMRTSVVTAFTCVIALGAASGASAQAQTRETTWAGGYAGVTIGAGLQRDDASEMVTFDTNLDGRFEDAVRTVTAANAFSPGFCGGVALGALPGDGCTEDEDAVDFGGRIGYDWQRGRLVVGALADVSRANVVDGVTAFSTTPAFYAFSRELNYLAGLRARVGVGTGRVLVYGTGGAAWASIEHVFTSSNGVNTFTPAKGDARRDGAWGYQAGGGVEVRLGGRWSASGEYLFSSLDDNDDGVVRSGGPTAVTNPFILVNAAGTDLRRSDRFDLHSVRLGLSYRF